MSEFKPCPFCGSESEYVTFDCGDCLPGLDDFMVRCKGNSDHQLDHVGTKEEVADAWNTRASESAIRAQVIEEIKNGLVLKVMIIGDDLGNNGYRCEDVDALIESMEAKL